MKKRTFRYCVIMLMPAISDFCFPLQTNCTVAYLADCMPSNKCKSSCSSMGASAYRWFHDGCCQCVGPNCINNGVNESKCRLCPVRETGENGPMAIDKEQVPRKTEDGSDYEVGPAPVEEDTHRQENSVKPNSEANDKSDRESKSQTEETDSTTKKTS